jgi:hypothetical protein
LLGVRLVNAPRANPSPGRSQQHAFDIVMPGGDEQMNGGRRTRTTRKSP